MSESAVVILLLYYGSCVNRINISDGCVCWKIRKRDSSILLREITNAGIKIK